MPRKRPRGCLVLTEEVEISHKPRKTTRSCRRLGGLWPWSLQEEWAVARIFWWPFMCSLEWIRHLCFCYSHYFSEAARWVTSPLQKQVLTCRVRLQAAVQQTPAHTSFLLTPPNLPTQPGSQPTYTVPCLLSLPSAASLGPDGHSDTSQTSNWRTWVPQPPLLPTESGMVYGEKTELSLGQKLEICKGHLL